MKKHVLFIVLSLFIISDVVSAQNDDVINALYRRKPVDKAQDNFIKKIKDCSSAYGVKMYSMTQLTPWTGVSQELLFIVYPESPQCNNLTLTTMKGVPATKDRNGEYTYPDHRSPDVITSIRYYSVLPDPQNPKLRSRRRSFVATYRYEGKKIKIRIPKV